ncbi:unnamed protein product [Brassicogethes aeneus]|uniref:Histone-lysine N-methyltransferase ash1 n=1 Tax=Brassicogethes aeneus TaxID=1431903 RepID=A0A9P0B283_BRAAE|nr:unnamed protein product [Brassicogethes aeneus]
MQLNTEFSKNNNHKTKFAEWHFFASYHGKGPCDGVGETLKRGAARASLQLPFDKQISNPRELYQWAAQSNNLPKIEMASLPISRGSTYSSSDSDESDADSAMLAQCSLQEISQEDLAVILPEQQECDAFDFECNRTDKNSPQTGEMSGSDMELPQQAVNALIQRTTESSSESESHAPPPPSSLYANSLLQQFVAQTQMLNAPCPVTSSNADSGKNTSGSSETQNAKPEDNVKKRRGRPKKSITTDYCANPNVSPDSGIQNSPDHVSSPEPQLSPNVKQKTRIGDLKKSTNDKKSQKCGKTAANVLVNKSSSKTIKEVSNTSSKIPVISNRFDRQLYANADRVLYPPRRKVGRPPLTKKGPGRPPKHKPPQEAPAVQPEKPSEKIKPAQKSKSKSNKPVLTTKNKLDVCKTKSVVLKNAKLMHSKHKHKKHKKYKFKILKPISALEPKVNIEIDKLIADFVKYCVIDSLKTKENLPEIIKTLKKVSKKRKTTEHNEKKKKKQSVSTTVNKVTNSNEQRLPLKKRHYHISVNEKEDSEDLKEETEPKKISNKQTIASTKVEKVTKQAAAPKVVEVKAPSGPKYVPVIKTNTNSKVQTINNNEYEVKNAAPKKVETHIEETIEACINRFSDEKGKVVKVEDPPIKEEKLNTSNSSITPKKRHRLENMYSPTKIDTSPPVEDSKISVETFINELKMKRNFTIKTSPENEEDKKPVVSEILAAQQPPKLSPETTKKKVRKRRAINRTGFPTVKKKKKKLPVLTVAEPSVVVEETKHAEICDRVPKVGEECAEFVERTKSPEVKVNENVKETVMNEDNISLSKWGDMSDCDSLPQDERIDELDDSKSETSTSKIDDGDDVDSNMSLESSIERLKSRLNQRKRKRGREKIVDNLNGYPKRRLRDVSPASSVEPIERRLRGEDRASASGDESKKSKKLPKWKKKHLVAGLFSDYYKEDDEAARIRRTENAAKSRLVYNPEEHPFGLLPPPYHCGKYLRCRKLPFQLPHDLWWQHTHSQLPGRDLVPSWNYRKIRTNVYNVKLTTGACEPQSCNCKTTNCGDDCINRLVLAECPPYHKCQNQRIQKHEWSPGLEKFMTESKGWGVRTKMPIRNGDFILEYVGEVVSDQEFKERMGTIYVNDNHHYCLHLDGGLVIDGHRMGGDGRFVNHSCQPNCEMQKWSVNGQFRMALFALRDIQDGEELTYDYNFSLFNAAEGQECKCGSEECRGVIGGKSQRVRQLAKPHQQPVAPPVHVKPVSHQQKCFIVEHHCFLLRNLGKVRKVRNAAAPAADVQQGGGSAFLNQLKALQKPRNMRTRKLAQAEEDPELNKTVKLAAVLKEIWGSVISAKDEKGEVISTAFMTMPSKRKVPDYYVKITDPIDLSTIEQNIETGIYKTPNNFDEDMNKLFANHIKFYGRTSDVGVAATKLKKVYTDAKQQSLHKFEDALGKKPPMAFSKKKSNEEEDIIRCICGMHRDEGLMIQCERCMVWQHCECVKADASAPSYHCEICVPREVDYEIPLDEYTEHGHRYYLTLMRGDLQLRQGDTVYVLRDIPIPNSDKKHTYDTIGKIEYSELDIFRIERLWKDSKTGKRLAYGHHYLRPHETYHEPTRNYFLLRFFPNEVMRVPLYEAVPVELIITHCWVMDINTYCKGRPIDAPEEHIYICEYRVDKSARIFSKISNNKFPNCTKSFAFERFETRLKISRTYTPHDLDPTMLKPRGRKANDEEAAPAQSVATVPPVPAPPARIKSKAQRKSRLNKILLNLLGKMPSKQVLDLSYLLEGSRRRKKQAEPNNSKS